MNNMKIKNFFASKINWMGIILVLVSLQDFITTFDFSTMTLKSWVTFGIGLVIVILRTYFTSAKIGSGTTPPAQG
jgi:hypothetical protein